jgi:hypothetical protein
MRAALAICFIVAGFLAVAAQERKPPPPPVQPIPFSHKEHAGKLELECAMCHPNADPGESMGLPAASACMDCHASIKTDSPHIQKLAAFAKNNRKVPWARVYEIPTYVLFSHRAHLTSGNTCAECHGPVAEREQLHREGDISMGGCMACHSKKKASNDCSFCHEQR